MAPQLTPAFSQEDFHTIPLPPPLKHTISRVGAPLTPLGPFTGESGGSPITLLCSNSPLSQFQGISPSTYDPSPFSVRYTARCMSAIDPSATTPPIPLRRSHTWEHLATDVQILDSYSPVPQNPTSTQSQIIPFYGPRKPRLTAINQHRQLSEIWIYSDEGTSRSSCTALAREISKLWPYPIRFVTADHICNDWEFSHTFMLIMGGGVCSVWEKSLGHIGMLKIHEYVLNGGRFLGICAGAYFACRESQFVTPSQRIVKERPVNLFECKAIGPFTPTDDVLSAEEARAIPVVTFYETQGLCYVQGGPSLRPDAESDSFSIASFDPRSLSEAILFKVFPSGGIAIASGPHVEYSFSGLPTSSGHSQFDNLTQSLSTQETFRETLWTTIRDLCERVGRVRKRTLPSTPT